MVRLNALVGGVFLYVGCGHNYLYNKRRRLSTDNRRKSTSTDQQPVQRLTYGGVNSPHVKDEFGRFTDVCKTLC